MIFEESVFIKAQSEFKTEYTGENKTPLFRKEFEIDDVSEALLYVCALGCGYFYINGEKVSDNLLSPAVSNYNKTLWYDKYNVGSLLRKGKNIICAELGNGWLNEELDSTWHQDKAVWRDNPKFILSLQMDGKTIVKSDETWKCKKDSATYFNQLRAGEYFDARKYDANWIQVDYSDFDWEAVVVDNNVPAGVFRECKCEGITEDRVYVPKEITKVGDKKYIFDFGQNLSGFIRITLTGNCGDEITIQYEEELREEFALREKMKDYYYEGQFQTDKVICSENKFTWSPKFTYHGFRYAVIDGINDIDDVKAEAVFIHQNVKQRTSFKCSNELFNKMYEAGVISTYSNMFYMITDCPTREKYGWMNDAQSSIEQILTNFEAEKVLEKWLQDIYDAMREDGKLPGIVPTAGWGYDWGNGPVSDGALFEIPFRIYMHTGNCELLINSIPYFDRYFDMLDSHRNDKGLVEFGLDDWTNPVASNLTPAEFINAVLIYEFYNIAALAACKKGIDDALYIERAAKEKEIIISNFVAEDGRCQINEQTAVALLIYFDICPNFEVSKQQLIELVEKENYHHKCGMVGMRRLTHALNKCGRADLAYKVLNAEGYPGYKVWFDLGATTLWETWEIKENHESKNHQMFSDFMSWFIKTILGVRINADKLGEVKFKFEPQFIDELTFAEGNYETVKGNIYVKWEKKGNIVDVIINKAQCIELLYEGKPLPDGESRFSVTL